jgi:hypothetical protein
MDIQNKYVTPMNDLLLLTSNSLVTADMSPLYFERKPVPKYECYRKMHN